MNRYISLALIGAIGLLSTPASGAGDVELGRAKSFSCSVCHGPDGKRDLPMLQGGSSKLAGMGPRQFTDAVKAYRQGQRFHPLMQFFVMPISDKDIEDLAAYYGSLKEPLYQRLGGKEAINAVVKDLLANGVADPRLKPRLSGMDAAKCERQLTDLLCEATGGPCKYTGRDMKTAHTGWKVTETEWQAFVDNLGKTFDRFNVPARERGELAGMLMPMKGDIVGR
jgi:hemoglobin